MTSRDSDMKILYGVNGEGMGHATRSQVVIESLLERHEVHVVASGAAFRYLSGVLPDVEEILGAKFVMEDGEIRRWATVRQNLTDVGERRPAVDPPLDRDDAGLAARRRRHRLRAALGDLRPRRAGRR